MGEDFVLPLCQWPPCRKFGAVFGSHLLHLFLRAEYMGLYLIDGRFDLHGIGNISKAVEIEIAHTDGTYLTSLQRLLHGAIGIITVTEILVQKKQVNIVRLKFPQT